MTAEQIRGYVFDLVGLTFTGVAVYVGVTKGVSTPEFSVFVAMAGTYLGIKAPTMYPPPKP